MRSWLSAASLCLAACGRPPLDGSVDRNLSCRVTSNELFNRQVEVGVRATFEGGQGVNAAAGC